MIEKKQLIGKWGNEKVLNEKTEMEFFENGNLIYTIYENGKKNIINLIFWVEGQYIFTDQPSHPQIEKTQAEIKGDVLILNYGEDMFVYNRIV